MFPIYEDWKRRSEFDFVVRWESLSIPLAHMVITVTGGTLSDRNILLPLVFIAIVIATRVTTNVFLKVCPVFATSNGHKQEQGCFLNFLVQIPGLLWCFLFQL
ncbi:hypothetical protein L596_002740 [Steinernema carpocapsae]|uniref:Uncharacterized protein n=1 Tax=Steinernema carpocapsae TaxID=34508 RepID=A0A4U8UQ44_STECR|nr:hypothetical protein L596_002740 [Steinernema carpocapsae]